MKRIIIVFICLCALVSSCQAGTIRRVKVLVSEASNGDGTTWANAYGSIQDAIDASSSGDEVWVMAYHDGTVYNQKIVLKDGVSVKGGYLGDDSDDDLRDISDNPIYVTTISASGLNDCVVYAYNITNTTAQTVLEYCTLRDGAGRSLSYNPYFTYGGGICCVNSSPTIKHCVVCNNTVNFDGGGIFADINSAPDIEYCTITSNTCISGSGSGICFFSGTCTYNTISSNGSSSGGGVYFGGYSSGTTVFTHNIVSYNSSSGCGGGVAFSNTPSSMTFSYNNIDHNSVVGNGSGGGIYASSQCNIDHCNATNNTTACTPGGGIYAGVSGTSIINCTVSGNSVGASASQYGSGGGIYLAASGIIVDHCTVSENTVNAFGSLHGNGGGIYSQYSSNTISNCEISNNSTALGNGGGIMAANVNIIACKIINNHAGVSAGANGGGTGGGISAGGNSSNVYCNVIKDNTANGGVSSGIICGGVALQSFSIFSNNTIVNNIAVGTTPCAAQISPSYNSSVTLYNNIIAGNPNEYGLYAGGAGSYNLYNNCFYGNGTDYYKQPVNIVGTVSGNPSFDTDGYHLAVDSPCIDAGYDSAVGSNWTDIDNNPRKYDMISGGAQVDIGAQEFQGKVATPTFTPDYHIFNTSNPFNVKIACSTPDADIWYSVGTNPPEPNPSDSNCRLYDPDGVVVVPNYSYVLKAKAFKTGWQPSNTKISDYEYEAPYIPPGCETQVEQPFGVSPFSPNLNLAVSSIYQSAAGPVVNLVWNDIPRDSLNFTSLIIKRIVAGGDWNSATVIYQTGNFYYPYYSDRIHSDTTAQVGVPYQYRITVGKTYGTSCFFYAWNDTFTINVTIAQQIVSMNQTVDSRTDTRYVEDKLVNFQFGSSIYKGGLYVGFANPTDHQDRSRAGRSYLRFPLTTPPNSTLWAGSLDAFFYDLRDGTTDSASVDTRCCYVSNDAWSDGTGYAGNCITWQTSPQFSTDYCSQEAVRVATASSPTDSVKPQNWCHWNNIFRHMAYDMFHDTDGYISFALVRNDHLNLNTDPNTHAPIFSDPQKSDGWAYFMKKEAAQVMLTQLGQDTSPRLLYAYGDSPAFVTNIVMTSPLAQDGSAIVRCGLTAKGIAYFNAPASTDSLPSLTTNNNSLGAVSYDPQSSGQQVWSAPFTVSTSMVSQGTIDITPAYNPFNCKATLQITN